MKASSCSALTTLGSIETMSPTCPTSCCTLGSARSASLSFCARIRPPSRPVRPTALPPAWLIRPTMSCCTSPASTHSTTSMVSASVTRMPWMKLPFLPRLVERRLDLRAAAVHHHRVHADQLEQHHVFREVGLQRRVGHGVAAVLDDDGLAVELADVGQRLGQDLGLVARGMLRTGSVMGGQAPEAVDDGRKRRRNGFSVRAAASAAP